MMDFMDLAIEEAYKGITNSHGGPFGSVIIKDGKVVGRGHNMVLKNNDPTMHGEISAIKDACTNLNTFDLTGCEIYTTGEPCHMCLCALMWANIKTIYYGCSIKDNEEIGFRDNKFNDIFHGREKLSNYLIQYKREECLKLFEDYKKMNMEKY